MDKDEFIFLAGNRYRKYLVTKIKNYKGNVVVNPTNKNGLKQTSEVLVFHIRSLAKERFLEKVGSIEQVELEQALEGLNDFMTM